MAFGDIRGTLQAAANNIANPHALTGSVAVSVGDLVFVALGEQTALTVTAVTSSFVTTYSATNAGLDAGTVTGRAFWGRVTSAGTLTSISCTVTASADNVSAVAIVIEGPFMASPLDANPALVEDISSPFAAPATGVLAQANEVVVAWSVNGAAGNWTATSPNVNRVELATQTILTTRIASQLVAATTSVTPGWTGTNPTDSVLGTNSFKGATVTSRTTTFDAVAVIATTAIKLLERLTSFGASASLDTSADLIGPAATPAIGGGFGAFGELAFGDSVLPGALYEVTTAYSASATLTTTAAHIILRTMVVAASASMSSFAARTAHRTTAVAASATVTTARSVIRDRTTTVAAAATVATSAAHIIPRTTAIAASAAVASTGVKVLARTMAISASATVSTSFTKIVSRTTAISASATVTTTRAHIIPRTSVIAASATIVTARSHIIPRTTLYGATGTVVTARTRTIPRTTLFEATGTVVTSKLGTIIRTTAFAAAGAVSSVATRIFGRTTAFAGSGAVATTAQRIINRSTVFGASASISSVGTVEEPPAVVAAHGGGFGAFGELAFGAADERLGQLISVTMTISARATVNTTATWIKSTAIIYDFPIGKSLGSDYGLRGSRMANRYGYRPKIRSGSYR